MNHLSEEQLIKYQFELLEEDERAGIAEHLEHCAACRSALEQIDQRFSSLDLLDRQEVASEELITRTLTGVSEVKASGAKKLNGFRYFRIAAVVMMAVGVIAIMQTIDPPDKRLTTREGISPQPSDQKENDFSDQIGDEFRSKHVSEKKADKDSSNPEQNENAGVFAKEEGDKLLPATELKAGDLVKSELADLRNDTLVASAENLDSRLRWNDMRRDRGQDLVQVRSGDDISSLTVGARLGKDDLFEKPPFAPASAIELNVLPRREDLQLTIYNSADLTLVREKRHLTLKRGWNWLQFMWANTLIDPTSLHLEPLANKDKVDIELLSFPPRLKELGRWLIRSEVEGQVPFELTYFTSGLSWRAFYMGTLTPDETKMTLSGYVRVANASGEDYPEAQTRLLVGKINLLDEIAQLAQRQHAFLRPDQDKKGMQLLGRLNNENRWRYFSDENKDLGDMLYSLDIDDLQRKDVKKEGLSEYFLYTIEGRETIPDGWGKRLPSFETENIPVESLYKFDNERWGRQTMRFVSFANDPEHKLGETPIPDGNIKLFHQVDERQHLSYVGGSSFKYIPVGEKVELPMGAAQLVQVKPTLMETRTENYLFDDKGNISGWDERHNWELEVTNTRKLPAVIEITRGFGTSYWDVTYNGDGVSYEKHDATHARFELTVQPQTEQTFTYNVRIYYKKRQEFYQETK